MIVENVCWDVEVSGYVTKSLLIKYGNGIV